MNQPVEEGIITDAKKRYSAGVLRCLTACDLYRAKACRVDAVPNTGPGSRTEAQRH